MRTFLERLHSSGHIVRREYTLITSSRANQIPHAEAYRRLVLVVSFFYGENNELRSDNGLVMAGVNVRKCPFRIFSMKKCNFRIICLIMEIAESRCGIDIF